MTEPLESRLDVSCSVFHSDLAELRFSFYEGSRRVSGAFIGTERVIPSQDRNVRRALNTVILVLDVDATDGELDKIPSTRCHEYTFFPRLGCEQKVPLFIGHVCYPDDIPFVDHDMGLLVQYAPAFAQMRRESGAGFLPENIRNVLGFLSSYA